MKRNCLGFRVCLLLAAALMLSVMASSMRTSAFRKSASCVECPGQTLAVFPTTGLRLARHCIGRRSKAKSKIKGFRFRYWVRAIFRAKSTERSRSSLAQSRLPGWEASKRPVIGAQT